MISAHLQSKNRILLVCKLTFNRTNRNTAYKIFLYKRIQENDRACCQHGIRHFNTFLRDIHYVNKLSGN